VTATTIFALSSGAPPAGIAVVRISGKDAGQALRTLSRRDLPQPRYAVLTSLYGADTILDTGLVLWFPGPNSATGEDVAELHLHGGRAVIAAVLAALEALPGLRPAEPGEFTRRAFENGRIDLAEAEGLADLLRAETENQRRGAIAQAKGGLGRLINDWQRQLTNCAARVEAAIDFSDEDDVGETIDPALSSELENLKTEIDNRLADPPAERLRDGLRVVITGKPNAGKSSLLNALVARDAAIVSPVAGTTRDVIEAPINLRGLPLILIDTAGIRELGEDAIEAVGIGRARDQARDADIILALDDTPVGPTNAVTLRVQPKSDLGVSATAGLSISVVTGDGIDALRDALEACARSLLPLPDRVALSARHRAAAADARSFIAEAVAEQDLIVIAEHLRAARMALGRITGDGDVDTMLDALFGAFCIGK